MVSKKYPLAVLWRGGHADVHDRTDAKKASLQQLA